MARSRDILSYGRHSLNILSGSTHRWVVYEKHSTISYNIIIGLIRKAANTALINVFLWGGKNNKGMQKEMLNSIIFTSDSNLPILNTTSKQENKQNRHVMISWSRNVNTGTRQTISDSQSLNILNHSTFWKVTLYQWVPPLNHPASTWSVYTLTAMLICLFRKLMSHGRQKWNQISFQFIPQ